MLQIIIETIAASAIHQLDWQLPIADPDSMSPMQMIIGPVTTGGKNFITFFAPKALNRPASTKYKKPAQATPMQA